MNRHYNFVLLAVLLSALLTITAASTDPVPQFPYAIKHHDLKIELDLLKHDISAIDLLTLKRLVPNATKVDFLLRRGLQVNSVQFQESKLAFKQNDTVDPFHFQANVDSEDVGYYQIAQELAITLPKSAQKLDIIQLQIAYSGIISDSLKDADFSKEYVAMQVTGIIDTVGVYLAPEAIYYPTLPDQIFTYSLQATLPKAYQSVSEGALTASTIASEKRIESWVDDQLLDGFHLLAGQYQVNSIEHGKVKINTYFFPAEGDLSAGYLDACKGYFDLYEGLLGSYPFPKFAVVDNFMATGYGMPSFTLLGSQVLRLPFIKATSLGHEICHNWWGNSVYVDYKSGNWCEGLTTYCADYLYKEKKSAAEARDYRMGLLRDYSAYTHDANDFPLKDFRERHNSAQRAVGYGKSAMVFHMLHSYVGDEVFWRALQRFYQDNIWKFASWDDVCVAFEAESSDKLAWYFDQWVDRSGAPTLILEAPKKKKSDGRWEVSFTLKQGQTDAPFSLEIPVLIKGAEREINVRVGMNEKQQNFHLVTFFEPTSLAIDPNFDLFRRPDKAELAPTLAEVFGAQQLLIILPSQAAPELQKAYQNLAEQLKSPGDNYRVVRADGIRPDDLTKEALLFLGTPAENKTIPEPWLKNERWRISETAFTLLGKDYADTNSSFVAVERNLWNKELVIGYCCARQAGDLAALGRKLKHYGKYSYLVFKGSDNVAKGNWEPSDSPLIFKF